MTPESVGHLGPGLDPRQQRTRKHQRFADPVGLVDDAQAVGVAVGYEDAEGERALQTHLQIRLTSIELEPTIPEQHLANPSKLCPSLACARCTDGYAQPYRPSL